MGEMSGHGAGLRAAAARIDVTPEQPVVLAGYLGTAQDFRERYELPIAKEKDAKAQTRLARRLRPFMLRRLKAEVASDLPTKLEQVSFCDLTPDQRRVYQQVIEASRKEVLEAVGAQGVAKSRMVVLTALLRLRQVCCDLRLLKLEKRSDAAMDCGGDAKTGSAFQESRKGKLRKQKNMGTTRSANFEPNWKLQPRRPRRFANVCKKKPSPPRKPPTRLSTSIRIRPLESHSAWAC
jgi:SNF2 family DNA or RNA helicase